MCKNKSGENVAQCRCDRFGEIFSWRKFPTLPLTWVGLHVHVPVNYHDKGEEVCNPCMPVRLLVGESEHAPSGQCLNTTL